MAPAADLLDAVDTVYAAALDGGRWGRALTEVADLLGGVDATLEVHHRIGTRPFFFASGTRLPPVGIDAYLAYYAKVCPRIPYVASLKTGGVGCDHGFISEAQIDRNEFYADFLGPSRLRYFAAGMLVNKPGRLAGVYVHRSPTQGHPGDSDLSLLSRLVPHVARSLDLHLRLKERAAGETRILDLLDRLPQAILTLDDRGDVLFANETAAAMLRHDDGLKLRDGRFRLGDTTANGLMVRILGDLLKRDLDAGMAAGGHVVARRPSGRAAYVLTVHRLSGVRETYEDAVIPAAAIFVYDPEMSTRPRASALAQAFSLTPREAALAVSLFEGWTLREHAEARGVTYTTERTHLRSLMLKTATHRQTDLVRLLAGFFSAVV